MTGDTGVVTVTVWLCPVCARALIDTSACTVCGWTATTDNLAIPLNMVQMPDPNSGEQ